MLRLAASMNSAPGSPLWWAYWTILANRSRALYGLPDRAVARIAQVEVAVISHRLHKLVGDGNRDVEIGDGAFGRLAFDEFLDVRMIDAQHAHVGAAASAALGDFAKGLVVDAQKADGTRGATRRGVNDVTSWGADG